MAVIFKLAFSRTDSTGNVTDGFAATDRHTLWNRAEPSLRKAVKSVPGVNLIGEVVIAPSSMGLAERLKNDGRIYLEFVDDAKCKVSDLVDVAGEIGGAHE